MCESLKTQEKAFCEVDQGRCIAVSNACSTLKDQPIAKKVAGAKILWVDDNPNNNRHERDALGKLGAVVIISESTDEALKAFKSQRIDLVISDFSRRDDPQAGYTLLDSLKRTSSTSVVPYVIFSSSSTPSFISETKKRGAFGQTSRPTELLSLVVEALSTQ
ncbi:hypothetical protein GCM10007320_65350 [Pseudorhodoferax aquiterrae]|uniref:Response regulatory domain-containing protein n=2 Tax=Pseudorhodoferax aquiterrae TaxID=747304 RepID=A0ABQ3GFH8_9BURK|nr:hypothetical protein GCM10007320_65350 [Pseudorhodoferax aquiterrae]